MSQENNTTQGTSVLQEDEHPNQHLLRHELGKRFAEKIVLRAEYDEDIIQDMIVFCETIIRDIEDNDGHKGSLLINELAESTMEQAYSMSKHAKENRREYARRLHEKQGMK
jgi:hypothetical protein